MKRIICLALLMAPTANALQVGVDCDWITNWPDWPRKICVGYPHLQHKCAYWAARGWNFMTFPYGPTFPLARVKCAANWKGSMVSFIAWQTYLTYKEPWEQGGDMVTEEQPLALEYTTGQCNTFGVQLP